ncbi:MAG: hypothetical protein GY928_24310 [Colwellia sp.]|nr:hypothetical protein [Colwellia sp.]
MMSHNLSFAKINILSENIAEVIVNQGVEISLEMSEEYHDFLTEKFSGNFAVLVNKINQYDFSFEAKLNMASHENLKAIAVVIYNEEAKQSVDKIANLRQVDGWNLQVFNGLNLGWQQGLDWLQDELNTVALDG